MINLQHIDELEPIQPIEIDWAVNTIKNIFKSSLDWLTQPYGRVYKLEHEEKLQPYVYVGNTDGKYSMMNVTPDNDKKGMCYFVIEKERVYSEGYMIWNVGIVFWVNLSLINDVLAINEDFTQKLIRDVRTVLNEELLGIGFKLEILEITRDFNEVFREFNIKDRKQGAMPFSCFRVNTNLIIQEDCISGGGEDPGNDGAPVITNETQPNYVSTGLPYELQITASGTVTGYAAINLPEGLEIDNTTGVISGTIEANAGVIAFNIQASNSNGIDTKIIFLTIVDFDINELVAPFDIHALYSQQMGGAFGLQYNLRYYKPKYERLEIFIDGELYRTFVNNLPYDLNKYPGVRTDLMQKVPPFNINTPYLLKMRVKNYLGVYSEFSEEITVIIPNT